MSVLTIAGWKAIAELTFDLSDIRLYGSRRKKQYQLRITLSADYRVATVRGV